ncbi:MAG: carbohydrate ABC transporter permease [Blautia sp.]
MDKRKRMLLKNWMGCFAFALPALLFYCLFLVIPIFSTVRISFHEWNGAAPFMKFVGLDNYARVLKDPIFYKALGNNVIWILFTIFVPVLLGLIFAVMLTQKYVKKNYPVPAYLFHAECGFASYGRSASCGDGSTIRNSESWEGC